jgi:tRNA uridine 5-carbamoylmethylation protein Kti12
MVLNEIEKLIEKETISDNEMIEKLYLSGLLHDIGKTICCTIREMKKKKIKVFNGHDYAGAIKSIGVIKKYYGEKLTEEKLRDIIIPILYHQQAHNHPVTSDNPNYKHLTDTQKQILSILSEADDKGRISEFSNRIDLDEYENKITEYEKYLEQSGKYERELHLFFGIPGAGKTTKRYELIEKYGADRVGVVSHDDVIEKWAREHGMSYREAYPIVPDEYKKTEFNKMVKAAKEKDIVIVDMTNLTKKSRRFWFNEFRNRKKIIHIFLRDYDEIIKVREEKMDKSVIDKMLTTITVPSVIDEKIDEVKIHIVW